MAPNTETVENPFGIMGLWEQSDAVIKGTLFVLIAMSFASWFVIFTKLWDQRRMRKQYEEMEKNFWTAGNLREGIAKIPGKDNVFKLMAEDGMRAAQHHEGRLTDQIPLHEWISASLYRAVDAISSRLQGGMAILATTGSTAPFIGLFGTVWGIMDAFLRIGLEKSASLPVVAPAIGEALIATAFGLVAAIPATIGYNYVDKRIGDLLEELNASADVWVATLLAEVHQPHSSLRPSERQPPTIPLAHRAT